jgi:hypothetical protein
MKLLQLVISTLIFAVAHARSVESEINSVNSVNEPRIFFRQVLDATGFFPIEVNIPDTISAMMSGIGNMYDAMSMYFGSGSGSENTQGQQEQIIKRISQKQKQQQQKRVKKLQKKKKVRKTERDNNYGYYYLFSELFL